MTLISYPEDENAVDDSDGHEEDVEGLSKILVFSAMDH